MTRIRPGSMHRVGSDVRQPLETAPSNHFRSTLESNPFATRFTRPGALPYLIWDDQSLDKTARLDPEVTRHDAASGPASAAAAEPLRSLEAAKPTDDRLAGWYDRAMDHLVCRLVRDRLGVIVGPHGTGKSTLLQTLMPSLRQEFVRVELVQLHGAPQTGVLRRWRHAGQGGRQVITASSRAGDGALLVVDGIEQLNRWDRHRLLWSCRRRGQAVLATSHRPLSGMPVLHTTRIDADLIQELVGRLLGPASAEVAAVARAEVERRDLDCVVNLRDLWFELYDVVQPMLISAPPHDTSKILHGRTLVRHHDPVASPDREGGADC